MRVGLIGFLLRKNKEVVCWQFNELDKPDDVGVVDLVHDLYLSLEVREVLRSGARLGDRLYGVALPGNRVWKRWVVGQNTLAFDNNPKLAAENNVKQANKQRRFVFYKEEKRVLLFLYLPRLPQIMYDPLLPSRTCPCLTGNDISFGFFL